MWIWELPSSDGGNVAAIIAQAKRYGIGALYIKSSDGTGYWSQFSRTLVTDLHEAGLKVCAWQYVYGSQPGGRGQPRSAGRQRRRRLPRDRRRIRVPGQVPGRADLHRAGCAS